MGENRYRATRNPELWLAPPSGWGVLAGRLVDQLDRPIPAAEIHVKSQETGREWVVFSYAQLTVNPDDVYDENFVLSDLPEGKYAVTVAIAESTISGEVYIHPGQTNFVLMKDGVGMIVEPPILQPATLIPYSTKTPTPTPTVTRTPSATPTVTPTR
ncbi:MAG: carboxypeptidase regulatory-like domain-containing protein [Chloroflexi bacterium]|nr:carboxypeptidase regulatory-like domain-containing protein [Chloroflexota bacterium]